MKKSAHSSISVDCHIVAIEDRQFCTVVMRGPLGLAIGDSDALTVKELMERSIQDMLTALNGQLPLTPAPEGTAESVFLSMRNLRESTPAVEASFYAVPRAVECFDGEAAYFIRHQDGAGRFIWQDFATKQVRELILDFDEYCSQWKRVCISLMEPDHGTRETP